MAGTLARWRDRLVLRLMNSPLAPALPTSLIAIRYTGRSGATVVLPLQAVRHGQRVAVLVGDADARRWWHHFVGPAALDVLVDGRWTSGHAAVKVGPMTAPARLYRTAHPDHVLDHNSVLLGIVLDQARPDGVVRTGKPLGPGLRRTGRR
ncbi:hypothetical protein ACIBL3_21900 [Kribbella sp. NPDC050124]|uniref:hypothetical protein n=1 Tax=Kribbella sp. NPDC050124 TaxID=3364114 RepID=UPI0037AD46C2